MVFAYVFAPDIKYTPYKDGERLSPHLFRAGVGRGTNKGLLDQTKARETVQIMNHTLNVLYVGVKPLSMLSS
jgi:hypothetical protein